MILDTTETYCVLGEECDILFNVRKRYFKTDKSELQEEIDVAKVILMCGKICSGKSFYADSICKNKSAVILSVDEIMLAMFGQDAGEKHDDYVAALEKYLLKKSTEFVEAGIDVVMDIGLWTKAKRKAVRDFYSLRNIESEIHYLDISDTEWKKRIEKRNDQVSGHQVSAYYIDEGLAKKASHLFDKPDRSEVDVWVNC